jgi:1-deoxy-D-xylulose-5-phosphate reductoisomerase
MGTLPNSVSILGGSGSVGASTVAILQEVSERTGEPVAIEAITVGANVARAVELAHALRPKFLAVADESLVSTLRDGCRGLDVEVAGGPSALVEAAERPAAWVMSAIVGVAGMAPTLAAIKRGARLALANKESLVCAGAVMLSEAAKSGATILPVDSEHSAIFQALDQRARVEKVVITASGGPFRTWTMEQMRHATPTQAVAHPNWTMGQKISVDSATLMNKGLELIEASLLFSLTPGQLKVTIHPQSIVHSFVAYCDGSVLAQMAAADMRVPIAYALSWPDRTAISAKRLDLTDLCDLTFTPPDESRFPALALARAAMETGGSAPAILNAANEIAVDRFLSGRIGFLDIVSIVDDVLQSWDAVGAGGIAKSPSSFDQVQAIDAAARALAKDLAQKHEAA